MTEPTTRIDGVRQQGCVVDDADQSMLVSVVAVDLLSAALWLVKRSGEAVRIGKTPAGCPKIDSAWPCYFADGTARLCMAQADVGGGGATSHLTWIDFPDAFSPPSNIAAGSAYVEAPNYGIRVLAQGSFNGTTTIDLAHFGIPLCQLVNLKLTVSGPAGRRGHIGPVDSASAMLTCACQVDGVRNYVSGAVAPSDAHTLTVKSEGGSLSEIHVDIFGWTL